MAPRAKILSRRDSNERDVVSSLAAHDLKSPLAAISMNLEFILAELDGTGRASGQAAIRAALEDCKRANDRAVRIVSDMTDALRLTSGDLRPSLRDVAVSQVIAAVVNGASAEAAARGVRIVSASDGGRVRADVDLLEGVLDRLIERAVRHSSSACTIDHRGGAITVRADTLPAAVEAEAAGRALSILFAEAAVRAQGGRFRIEVGAGTLAYGVELQAC